MEKAQAKRYIVEVLPPIALALVPTILLLSPFAGNINQATLWLLVGLAFLGSLLFVFTLVKHARRADEYQRRGLVISYSAGFAASMLTAFGIMLSELAGWKVPLSSLVVLVAGMTAWLVVAVVQGRR